MNVLVVDDEEIICESIKADFNRMDCGITFDVITAVSVAEAEVILENEKIVGEVAIHETDIITDKGNVTELTLSQCAVLPEYRKQGIMRMLVEEGLKIAKNMGYGAVFLGGNTVLYSRFGFEPSYKYGIYHKDREKWGDEGFMVYLLRQGALDGITGITDYYGG